MYVVVEEIEELEVTEEVERETFCLMFKHRPSPRAAYF